MQAEIIIQHGQAKLLHPLYLKSDAPTHYKLEIPDDVLVEVRDWHPEGLKFPQPLQQPPTAQPGSLQERFNQILGKLAMIRSGASIGDDFQMLQDALEERYFGR